MSALRRWVMGAAPCTANFGARTIPAGHAVCMRHSSVGGGHHRQAAERRRLRLLAVKCLHAPVRARAPRQHAGGSVIQADVTQRTFRHCCRR